MHAPRQSPAGKCSRQCRHPRTQTSRNKTLRKHRPCDSKASFPVHIRVRGKTLSFAECLTFLSQEVSEDGPEEETWTQKPSLGSKETKQDIVNVNGFHSGGMPLQAGEDYAWWLLRPEPRGSAYKHHARPGPQMPLALFPDLQPLLFAETSETFNVRLTKPYQRPAPESEVQLPFDDQRLQ
ncbi:unnamed protein product [Symbiodinium pilosum]|uniref:Uncharacterized protein n=1 Tax=Symbiodinium pilosum TaxID=2952 RepID=A0A812YBV0_SYMPI|nr:unnamed protein product [Symbiodinium pilosum]